MEGFNDSSVQFTYQMCDIVTEGNRFQTRNPSTSCTQLRFNMTQRTMCVKSAENPKQILWLNSLWQIQMFSSLAFCENLSITSKKNKLGGCFGLVFRFVLLWRCCSGFRNASDLGRNGFQTSSFSACAQGRGGTLYIAWKVLTSPPTLFSSLPRWNIRSWKSICQRYRNGLFQHHGIISPLSCALDSILNFSGDA